MDEVQDQHISRIVTSNQISAIPLHPSRTCIFPMKSKNLLPSNCILDTGWARGEPAIKVAEV